MSWTGGDTTGKNYRSCYCSGPDSTGKCRCQKAEDLERKQVCLLDGVEKGTVTGISCSCPKCTPR